MTNHTLKQAILHLVVMIMMGMRRVGILFVLILAAAHAFLLPLSPSTPASLRARPSAGKHKQGYNVRLYMLELILVVSLSG